MKKLSQVILYTLVPIFSFANDYEALSDTKQEIIKLKKEQIEEKEKVNKYDWVSDLKLNASINKDEDDTQTDDYYISISQEIFNFGGISSQIDYAKELKKMENLSLQMNNKDDLNTLFSLLIDVKIAELELAQNSFYIKNSQINIRNKKSEYKAGELDISDLNDAIMTRNQLSDKRKELELSKLITLNSIKKYSNKKHETINIPNVKLMSKDIYLQNASSLKYAKLDIDVNNSLYKIKKSDYLPSLSVTGKYGYKETSLVDGDNYYSYGLNVSMPLNFSSSSDIEQTKINYLISQKELSDELINSESIYEAGVLNINSYKSRIRVAKNDIALYDELLEVNEEEYKAGYKTLDDVETLKNSKSIRALDIKSYELNIQKQIFALYFKI